LGGEKESPGKETNKGGKLIKDKHVHHLVQTGAEPRANHGKGPNLSLGISGGSAVGGGGELSQKDRIKRLKTALLSLTVRGSSGGIIKRHGGKKNSGDRGKEKDVPRGEGLKKSKGNPSGKGAWSVRVVPREMADSKKSQRILASSPFVGGDALRKKTGLPNHRLKRKRTRG